MTQPLVGNAPPGAAGPPTIDWPQALAEHDRWLRTVVYARLGEPQAVDDVMQEVAVAALAERAPLLDATRVGPWLYRVAVTQSLLYRRKHGRIRKLQQRYADRVAPSAFHTDDPLGWLLADERKQILRSALDRLTRRDREILLLKYTQDWSYREIASRLGISQSAVQTRLHRARGRLRDELASLELVEV